MNEKINRHHIFGVALLVIVILALVGIWGLMYYQR